MDYTKQLNLQKPVYEEPNWHIPLNQNADAMEFILAAMKNGNYCIDDVLSPQEGASGEGGDDFDIHTLISGSCMIDGVEIPQTANITYHAGQNQTKYLYMTASGMQYTTTLPATWHYTPIAIVTTNETGIEDIADVRIIRPAPVEIPNPITKDYCLLGLNTDLTGLTVDSILEFEKLAGNLNITDYKISLLPDKTYKLTSYMRFSLLGNGYCNVQWYTDEYIGFKSFQPYNLRDTINSIRNEAIAIITPKTNITVELRLINVSALNLVKQDSYAIIEEI